MLKGTRYTSEIKRKAVKIALSLDRRPRQIATELGIRANTLYILVSTTIQDKILPAKATA